LFLTALTCLAFLAIFAKTTPTQSRPLPNPVLYFAGAEPFKTGGKDWVRYSYIVDNQSAYPNDLFEVSPALPPCGTNKNSSRTWVEVYDQSGKRLQGFCVFGSGKDLEKIWFAIEGDTIPPSWIYIEMNDRKTNTKYKSNLAETTM
jgi:hypothetical protein